MTTSNVRYITNGYIVTASGLGVAALESIYAATIPEVVYWLGRIFDPINSATQSLSKAGPPNATPMIITPADDPLLGQSAKVDTIASGGFLVTQFAGPVPSAKHLEVYCPNMDAVSDALTAIFTPPAQP